MKRKIAYCFLLLLYGQVFAQSPKNLSVSRQMDSLYAVLRTEERDTNKVKIMNYLCLYFCRTGKYDTALIYGERSMELAKKINYQRGLASSYRTIGTSYYEKGDYSQAIDYDTMALAISRKIADRQGIAACFRNIGMVYTQFGNYPEALKYYLDALEIFEEIKDASNIAATFDNLGTVYDNQNDHKKALEYYSNALALQTRLSNKQGIAAGYVNMGVVFNEIGNYKKALEDYKKALTIEEELGDKDGIAINLGNIADLYQTRGDLTKVREYELKALAIEQEIGSKDGIASVLVQIGSTSTMMKKYHQAMAEFDAALAVSKEIGNKVDIRNTYSAMAILDSNTHNYKQGWENYRNYVIYRDSLINEAAIKKTVQDEMNFEFEKKQASQRDAQDKKDALAEQARNKQIIIRNSLIAGFSLMFVLTFLIYRGYKQKQRANIVILHQKMEVEKQKEIVEVQKHLVEEKNKDILDSITYAKRLQDAILPPLSLIEKHLPESFVLYKPKDIVAGDFYWMEAPNLHPKVGILIAACDCTGHGVPGALVSIVCSNALNRAVKEFQLTEPGKILDKTRELVLETFAASGGEVKDGMDISLASLCPLNGGIQLQWAGAYNSLLYTAPLNLPDCAFAQPASAEQEGGNNVRLVEIPADKQPIGKTDNPKPFTTHTINLEPPFGVYTGGCGTFYLFTDGFPDQFGGPKGKKFKYKQFEEKLLAIAHKSMSEQKEILEKEFALWKGELEQTDDVCVIGIRI